jgi:hypothetical protein
MCRSSEIVLPAVGKGGSELARESSTSCSSLRMSYREQARSYLGERDRGRAYDFDIQLFHLSPNISDFAPIFNNLLTKII